LNEASALAVDCHNSLCVHSHPERKEKEEEEEVVGKVQFLSHAHCMTIIQLNSTVVKSFL